MRVCECSRLSNAWHCDPWFKRSLRRGEARAKVGGMVYEHWHVPHQDSPLSECSTLSVCP